MCVCCAPDNGEQQGQETVTGGKPDLRLSRSQRVACSSVFREAFRDGPHYVGRYMVMWLRTGEDASLRLGVIASKRSFGKAFKRSRAKRLLREAYRLNRYQFRGAVDVILIARRRIQDVARQEVEKDLLKLARRARLLEEPGRA